MFCITACKFLLCKTSSGKLACTSSLHEEDFQSEELVTVSQALGLYVTASDLMSAEQKKKKRSVNCKVILCQLKSSNLKLV